MSNYVLGKLLAQSFFWNVLGNAISRGSTFVVSVIAARALGIDDFGRIGLLQQTLAIFVMFGVTGLSVTSIKYLANTKHAGRKAAGRIWKRILHVSVFLSVAIGFLLYFSAGQVSLLLTQGLELKATLEVSALVVSVSAINQVQFGSLSGLGQFRRLAVSNIISGLVNIPVAFILMVQFGLIGFVCALLTCGAILLVINNYFIWKSISELEGNLVVSDVPVKDLLLFSLPNFFSGIIFSMSAWLVLVILSRNAGLLDVAVYNAANQIFGILYILPTLLAQVAMSLSAARDKDKQLILKNSVVAVAIFTVLTGVPVFLFSSELMAMYGSAFSENGLVLAVMVPALVLLSINNQFDHYALGQGWVKENLYLTFFYSVIFVVLALVLVGYGVLGVVIAKSLAIGARVFVSLIVYGKKIKGA